MKVIELSNKLKLLDEAINYFWNCRGNDSNFAFYKDCIKHLLNGENPLLKFYLAL